MIFFNKYFQKLNWFDRIVTILPDQPRIAGSILLNLRLSKQFKGPTRLEIALILIVCIPHYIYIFLDFFYSLDLKFFKISLWYTDSYCSSCLLTSPHVIDYN